MARPQGQSPGLVSGHSLLPQSRASWREVSILTQVSGAVRTADRGAADTRAPPPWASPPCDARVAGKRAGHTKRDLGRQETLFNRKEKEGSCRPLPPRRLRPQTRPERTPVPARWGGPPLTPSRRHGCPRSRSGLCGGTWAAPRSSARRVPSATAAASRGRGESGCKRQQSVRCESMRHPPRGPRLGAQSLTPGRNPPSAFTSLGSDFPSPRSPPRHKPLIWSRQGATALLVFGTSLLNKMEPFPKDGLTMLSFLRDSPA